MKEINIYSNPEYETPNEKICKSIINYVFSKEKINLYEISVIFTSDIYVSDLQILDIFTPASSNVFHCFET